ncbi:type II secretion system minor pseudopilin GspJ [Marinobacter sp. X15-166B]|uniref:type II secretion system minor pseudopilin GspJ n=1 Tax=Marinobacter sp. X15-166B TaxID=1897620 RepID=UPI00085C6BE4|nr:type II secretion system minor pseudopilin GspJ [Marinobacter sp. X15-166B]OEY67547.1 type II secretion system protein GspJ [Marinobacter sp. X15-166B]
MTRQSGFTLMEVLIAVTITAVIGLGVWQVMSSVVLSRDRVDEVAGEFNRLQQTWLMIERDIGQVVNRSVRNMYGDSEPALTSVHGDFSLLLTRQGWRNPLGEKRSELQRAGYEFTGDELRRRYWLMLDQGQDDTSRDQLLLGNVTGFDIRFLNEGRRWVSQWPTEEAMNNVGLPGSRSATLSLPMPLAVEITLTHERFGVLTRLFTLPNFSKRAAQRVISAGNVAPVQAPPPDEADAASEPDGAAQ